MFFGFGNPTSDPFRAAIEKGNVAEVKRLLSSGEADANSFGDQKNQSQTTAQIGQQFRVVKPLEIAVSQGNVELVEALISAGAAVNSGDKHILCGVEHLEHPVPITRALLRHGINLHVSSSINMLTQNQSPLISFRRKLQQQEQALRTSELYMAVLKGEMSEAQLSPSLNLSPSQGFSTASISGFPPTQSPGFSTAPPGFSAPQTKQPRFTPKAKPTTRTAKLVGGGKSGRTVVSLQDLNAIREAQREKAEMESKTPDQRAHTLASGEQWIETARNQVAEWREALNLLETKLATETPEQKQMGQLRAELEAQQLIFSNAQREMLEIQQRMTTSQGKIDGIREELKKLIASAAAP